MATYMDLEDLAKRIRDACLETVLQEYEDAGVPEGVGKQL
jgi:hypothetical protein